jgi:hypothetical protein
MCEECVSAGRTRRQSTCPYETTLEDAALHIDILAAGPASPLVSALTTARQRATARRSRRNNSAPRHAARRTPGAGEAAPWKTPPGNPSCPSREDAEPQHLFRPQINMNPGARFRPTGRYGGRRSLCIRSVLMTFCFVAVIRGSATSARPDAAADRLGRPDTVPRSAGCDGRTT